MKFVIGKKYLHEGRQDRLIYTCVGFHPDTTNPVFTYPGGPHYSASAFMVPSISYNEYVEYKEPKKVYCSVWRGGSSGYQWTIADLDSADYNKTKGLYLKTGYVMIKEWELEYEPS